MLSIVIPAYNEESCLQALFDRMERVLTTTLSDQAVEVIVVDDHSSDATPLMLAEAEKKYHWLKFVRLLCNSGSHVAVMAGLSVAKGDKAFIMAADLQDPPEIIPEFLKTLDSKHRIILGVRASRNDSWRKSLPSKVFHFLMHHLVLPNIPPNAGDIVMLDRTIIDALLLCNEKNINIFTLMFSLCRDVGFVSYEREARFAGESKWSTKKLVKLAYDTLITAGYLPIRFIFWMGVGAFLLSIALIAVIIVLKFLYPHQVLGWSSIIVAILAFGGIQLISTAFLGEYIWRNFDQTRKRPLFILEKSTSNKA